MSNFGGLTPLGGAPSPSPDPKAALSATELEELKTLDPAALSRMKLGKLRARREKLRDEASIALLDRVLEPAEEHQRAERQARTDTARAERQRKSDEHRARWARTQVEEAAAIEARRAEIEANRRRRSPGERFEEGRERARREREAREAARTEWGGLRPLGYDDRAKE